MQCVAEALNQAALYELTSGNTVQFVIMPDVLYGQVLAMGMVFECSSNHWHLFFPVDQDTCTRKEKGTWTRVPIPSWN